VSTEAFRLDMTMMFAMHDALRRELERIARMTARPDSHPEQILRTAAGWEMFKSYLRIHHTSEDDALWPVMSRALTARPDDLSLLDAMEIEHAAIDPLLNTIDAVVADPDRRPDELGDLVDRLISTLSDHLRHEEKETLPLINATLTHEQWQHFTEVHRSRIGTDVPRYFPWLLDSASPESVAAVLDHLPGNVRDIYESTWQPTYARLDPWGARKPDGGQ
jgi:hemerythrin-like domain-containing protein